jgi:hypothetical protein
VPGRVLCQGLHWQAVCCWCILLGLPRDAVFWRRVQDIGSWCPAPLEHRPQQDEAQDY